MLTISAMNATRIYIQNAWLWTKQNSNFRPKGEGRSGPLSGPAFSVVRQARGGSEAQMPKIKVNIN